MELRGFDSYDISLGDEMRGERASLGKSLADVEHDLRIKVRMIAAIEDCDLSGFANQSVIAGYVRSYARYLGMDAEDCYQRFCQESGYQSPAAMMSISGDGSAFGSLQSNPITAEVGAEIALSRFAAPPPQNRFRARVSLGAMTSTLALIGLICGLSYGGYALLQDIQRVGFAPLPEAPVVVADAPEIDAPPVEPRSIVRPQASDYQGGGVLAAIAAPAELPPVEKLRRDGPISAIDPTTAGLFVRPVIPPHEPAEPVDAEIMARAQAAPDAAPVDVAAAEPVVVLPKGIILHASEDAWVRIRSGDQGVVFEGILVAGEQFSLPERIETPNLKAGNAGGIFVLVDGVAYGPLGERGQVARNVSLVAEDVRKSMPRANPPDLRLPGPQDVLQRAEAQLSRP